MLFIIFIVVSIIISAIIYYTKSEEERKKESKQDMLTNTLLPSSFIALMVITGLYTIDFPKKEKILLDEDFWE